MNRLNIVTFNIRCFGFNGEYFATHKNESRVSFLKMFLNLNYNDTDVFVFQEIMDLKNIKSILPDGFKTYSYNHTYPRHMHIVLACSSKYKFRDITMIPDTTLDETKSRPAVYAQLNLDESAIADIIGVHLKSGFDHTDSRVKQCDAISTFIKKLNPKRPLVVAGDFNSHFKTKTKKPFDDLHFFQEALMQDLNFEDHNKRTYVLLNEDTQLDHIGVKNADIESLNIYDLNNYSSHNSLKLYYKQISDHLPVRASLILK